ncbi:MAG: hypothetical protein O3A90_13640 [Proteobacteria bacterium]|jgi:hypothetical protein|nr:hypothetical protein [Pseudomonadota bacterium]MDA1295855.1 hypothetical protein [Pseudomonadota bacterium]
MHMDLQTAVEAILKSEDPVTTVGDLIVAEGGFWNPSKVTDTGQLFTIQLFGVQSIGLGAASAIDNWLQRATDALQSEFSDTH